MFFRQSVDYTNFLNFLNILVIFMWRVSSPSSLLFISEPTQNCTAVCLSCHSYALWVIEINIIRVLFLLPLSIQFLLSCCYTVLMLIPLYSSLSLRLPKANSLSLIIFKVFIFVLCVNGLNPELSCLLINLINLPGITYVTHVYFTREAPFCKALWVTRRMALFIH